MAFKLFDQKIVGSLAESIQLISQSFQYSSVILIGNVTTTYWLDLQRESLRSRAFLLCCPDYISAFELMLNFAYRVFETSKLDVQRQYFSAVRLHTSSKLISLGG
jgi:hypothetical protein